MKNKLPNKIIREKHQLDAAQKIAGRLASQAAIILMGKQKVSYQPNIDGGDYVEVTNVDKLKFSGKKLSQKLYYRPSGYLGGLKSTSLRKIYQEAPELLFRKIVNKMLPKNKLKAAMLKRLTFKK